MVDLATDVANALPQLILELGRERARADAGGVRLGHAPYLVYRPASTPAPTQAEPATGFDDVTKG